MVRALEREHSIQNSGSHKMHYELPERLTHSLIMESGGSDAPVDSNLLSKSMGARSDSALENQQIGSTLKQTDKAPKSRLSKEGGGPGGKDQGPSGKLWPRTTYSFFLSEMRHAKATCCAECTHGARPSIRWPYCICAMMGKLGRSRH